MTLHSCCLRVISGTILFSERDNFQRRVCFLTHKMIDSRPQNDMERLKWFVGKRFSTNKYKARVSHSFLVQLIFTTTHRALYSISDSSKKSPKFHSATAWESYEQQQGQWSFLQIQHDTTASHLYLDHSKNCKC